MTQSAPRYVIPMAKLAPGYVRPLQALTPKPHRYQPAVGLKRFPAGGMAIRSDILGDHQ